MCETEGEKLQSKLSQLIKFQDNYCIVSCWLCFISATAVAQKRHSSLIFFLLRRFCKEKRACSFVCPTPLRHLSSEIGWNDFIVSSLSAFWGRAKLTADTAGAAKCTSICLDEKVMNFKCTRRHCAARLLRHSSSSKLDTRLNVLLFLFHLLISWHYSENMEKLMRIVVVVIL